jgi:hypothetical protein
LPLPTQFPAFGGQGKSRRPTAATQRTAIFGGERKSGKVGWNGARFPYLCSKAMEGLIRKMAKLQIGSLFWKPSALGGYDVNSAINIAR